MTAHPPPPWRLSGPAVIGLSLVDLAQARRAVPDDLDVVQVAPGRTLGGVLLARYGRDATFPYWEMAVVAGLVRGAGRVGGWVSHIYVDSDRSQRGGHELFGLPKQIASFTEVTTPAGPRVRVEGGEGPLLDAGWPDLHPRLRVPVRGTAFGSVGGDRRLLGFGGSARLVRTRVDLVVPDRAPFAHLGLARPVLGLAGRVHLLAGRRIEVLHSGPLPRP